MLRFSFVCWHRRFQKPRHCSNHDNKVSQLQVRNKTIYYTIETRDTLTIIELTKSREYKETRYKEIKSELLTPPSNFQLIFLEVTSLGFVTKNIKTFRNFLKSININERYLIEKLQEVAIRCSYFIYCRRKKNLISGGCFCTCSVVLCY